MIQSAVEECHASGPAHTGFFSTLFCAGAAVVKAFAAEQRGNVIDPSSPHCYGVSAQLRKASYEQWRPFFFPVLLDFSDLDTDQMGFFACFPLDWWCLTVLSLLWIKNVGFYTRWLHKCRGCNFIFLLLVLFAPVGWCSFCHHILLWFDSKHFLLFIRPFFKLLLKTQETTCKYTS